MHDNDENQKPKVRMTWEYVRAMIRYVWIKSYPSYYRGLMAVSVYDRYTGRKSYYLISQN